MKPTFPLLVRKQITERRVAKCYRLVGTKALHAVDIGKRDIEHIALDERGQSLLGPGKVDGFPRLRSIVSSQRYASVGVWTLIVACKRIIEIFCLDNDFQCSVGRPLETEEAGKEVFRRLRHAVLGCGPSNDLASVVGVQVTVLVLMQCAGVEQPGLVVSLQY